MAIVLKSTALENTYTIRIRMTLTKTEVGTPCAWKYCVGHIAGVAPLENFMGLISFFSPQATGNKTGPYCASSGANSSVYTLDWFSFSL